MWGGGKSWRELDHKAWLIHHSMKEQLRRKQNRQGAEPFDGLSNYLQDMLNHLRKVRPQCLFSVSKYVFPA